MARNAYGTGPANKEWGNKARKRETAQRNLNHQADAAAVAEGMIEEFDADAEYAVAEAWDAMYDDFWYDQD
jgi:hypothetical protein